MKSYRITELGRLFGLSRTTLLYYDRIGLLPPSGRTGSGYRTYTEADRQRLESICAFREAGLPLEDIRRILEGKQKRCQRILEARLREQAAEIRELQAKQRTLSELLRAVSGGGLPPVMDKETWVDILRVSGMDDDAMHRWHGEFERRAPDAHHDFLLSLGIAEKEALLIRKWSRNLGEKNTMEYFYEIFEEIPRQGPGCEAATKKAISLLPELPPDLKTLDVGCGSGASTLILAGALGGEVVAVDNHAPFLEELEREAAKAGLDGKIRTELASMYELPFEEESFDLIWSEGSLYIIGLERGLRSWRELLKPGGLIAFTELTWFCDDPPEEAARFWGEAYPDMADIEGNLERAGRCGYEVLEHFTLPVEAWDKYYYRPLEECLAAFEDRLAGEAEALEVSGEMRKEIELYRKCGESYGYVFYLLRKA